jgi:hypothetical protein
MTRCKKEEQMQMATREEGSTLVRKTPNVVATDVLADFCAERGVDEGHIHVVRKDDGIHTEIYFVCSTAGPAELPLEIKAALDQAFDSRWSWELVARAPSFGSQFHPKKNGVIETVPEEREFCFVGPVLGIWGHARSGKDTVHEIIAETRAGTQRFSFVDPFKKFCQQVYGFSHAQLWGDLKDVPDERYPRDAGPHVNWDGEPCKLCGASEYESNCITYLTPREALQSMTSWAKGCYPNTLSDHTFHEINEHFQNTKIERPREAHTFKASWIVRQTTLAVITDVRTPEEVCSITNAGGGVIRLTRPGQGLKGAAAEHVTESQFDDPAANEMLLAHIVNEGSINDLRTKINDVLAGVGL